MIVSLSRVGIHAPYPVVAPDKNTLLKSLEDWMLHHEDQQLPGSSNFLEQNGDRETCPTEVTFNGTSEQVWVEQFTSSSVMGWILKDDDGSCMWVLPDCRNRVGWGWY